MVELVSITAIQAAFARALGVDESDIDANPLLNRAYAPSTEDICIAEEEEEMARKTRKPEVEVEIEVQPTQQESATMQNEVESEVTRIVSPIDITASAINCLGFRDRGWAVQTFFRGLNCQMVNLTYRLFRKEERTHLTNGIDGYNAMLADLAKSQADAEALSLGGMVPAVSIEDQLTYLAGAKWAFLGEIDMPDALKELVDNPLDAVSFMTQPVRDEYLKTRVQAVFDIVKDKEKDLTFEQVLVAAKMDANRDRSQMAARRLAICEHIRSLSGDTMAVENFNGLPALIKAKLANRCIKTLDAAGNAAVRNILRNPMNANGDFHLLKSAKDEIETWVHNEGARDPHFYAAMSMMS